jgi:hypothetical protein
MDGFLVEEEGSGGGDDEGSEKGVDFIVNNRGSCRPKRNIAWRTRHELSNQDLSMSL